MGKIVTQVNPVGRYSPFLEEYEGLREEEGRGSGVGTHISAKEFVYMVSQTSGYWEKLLGIPRCTTQRNMTSLQVILCGDPLEANRGLSAEMARVDSWPAFLIVSYIPMIPPSYFTKNWAERLHDELLRRGHIGPIDEP